MKLLVEEATLQVGTTPVCLQYLGCAAGATLPNYSEFCDRDGCWQENVIDHRLLEFSVREVLNKTATRVMGGLSNAKVDDH
ncbi:MAG: hypothetical protein R2788_22690 [Saprospiraceae bacterium]